MYQNLKADIIAAMKQNDKETVQFLRYLDAGMQNLSIKLKAPIDNNIVIQVLKSELSKVKEEFQNAIKFNKPKISKQKIFEEKVIKKYLPKDLTEEEIKIRVSEIIKELNTKDFGLIMKTVKATLGNLVDMKIVSSIVKDLLNGK